MNTKTAYLVPYNADPKRLNLSGYPIKTMYQNLKKISDDKELNSVVVVMDACFSGAYDGGMIVKDASPLYLEVETPLLMSKNAVVLSSSRSDQVSSLPPEAAWALHVLFPEGYQGRCCSREETDDCGD